MSDDSKKALVCARCRAPFNPLNAMLNLLHQVQCTSEWVPSALPTISCSRCLKDLGEHDPTAPFTAGYYVVTSGYWKRFANPHEVFLCDACMWSDPAFVAERGLP